MKEIIDLCLALPNNALEYKNLIGIKNDDVERLSELIINGEISSSEDAINLLYNDKKFPRVYLSNAKKQLEERVINTFLSLKNPGKTEIQQVYFETYRKFAAFKVLRGQGKREASTSLAKKIIKDSIKYQFTEISLSLAKELKLYYSLISQNKKKFEYYKSLAITYGKIYQEETIVEEYLCQMHLITTNKKSFTEPELDIIQTIIHECQQLKYQSFRIIYLSANVKAIYYQIVNDYANLTKVCSEAIKYFESLTYPIPAAAPFSFLYKMIPSYIVLGNFIEAEIAIRKCLSIAPKGHFNWIRTKQYETIMHFHKGDFGNARVISLEILKKHKSQFEFWPIFNAYASILMGEKFRLGKFLNEVPKYSHDKKGMNINILIIQILHFLKQRKFGKVIDRMDALERYSYRYLRKNNTFRSNCLIHMLLQLEKGNFNKIAVQRKAAKYYDRLKSVPLHEAKQDLDLEIVPYEKLWEVILGYLD